MKILFNIPVHIHADFVNFQVRRFFKFYPNCKIILHIPKNKNIEFKTEDIKERKNLFINPNSVTASYNDICSALMLNYDYATEKKIKYDYMVFEAPASLPVFKGADEYMSRYDYGFFYARPGAPSSTVLNKICSDIGAEAITGTWEGSFYKKEIFDQMAQIIKRNYPDIYDDGRQIVDFGIEHYIFAIIAKKLSGNGGSTITNYLNVADVPLIDVNSFHSSVSTPEDLNRYLEANANCPPFYHLKHLNQANGSNVSTSLETNKLAKWILEKKIK